MPNIGPLEIVVVLIIVLIVFGPKRLPEMGRSLGKGIREFKNSITGNDEDDEPREIERRAQDSTRPLEGEVVHDRKP
jgi:sec-independent protein translocase protein TatA